MGKEKKEKNCGGDGWERFSSAVSSLSLSLLPTLLFVLIMAYVIVVGSRTSAYPSPFRGGRALR